MEAKNNTQEDDNSVFNELLEDWKNSSSKGL